MDQEIDVPSFFLCPISLEIMKDPVTISTGITYDRESIEKWLFSSKNKTCPVTKQVVSEDSDITPNHTLRRLLQAWCTMNASHGIERIPTPKPPVNKSQIARLLRDAKKSPNGLAKCLRELRSISSDSEANKKSIEAAGAVEFLASTIINNIKNDRENVENEDALSILHNLNLSEDVLKTLIGKEGEFVEALIKLMQRGSYESRAYAVMLLRSIFEVADSTRMANVKPEFFAEVVQVLNDQISQQASKATLQLLIQLCPWGRNRIKAVEAGAVMVLIELLLDTSSDRRTLEMTLMVLDMICGCAEGRAELLTHGAGLAVVSKKIMRVSKVASERAVRILFSICKFSATSSVLQEMMQLGVVAKLCLVLQVDSGSKTKDKAREVLKLHGRTWKNSTCIPSNLVSSYPS
ncbi:E3 ubiquitin-protein ligase PUB23-like [Pyrus ussuriensis x Pyrus communis]|uniref:U-box domain-containing protein n=1 Tax=Pyrus ussuriensis x Pyrus communis TaxID=2448454 RepID=A0A5N5FXY9_9ROSA|nr:E3 ubiquitin-protein ligase PUB23-like [Pyrus ussuriensis x Pyrus communis]